MLNPDVLHTVKQDRSRKLFFFFLKHCKCQRRSALLMVNKSLKKLQFSLNISSPTDNTGKYYRSAVPNFFGTRDPFHGIQLFQGPRGEGSGGGVQAVTWAMGSSRWSFESLPAAHFLLCSLVPNRLRTSPPPCCSY